MRKRVYRACLAWILSLGMVLSGALGTETVFAAGTDVVPAGNEGTAQTASDDTATGGAEAAAETGTVTGAETDAKAGVETGTGTGVETDARTGEETDTKTNVETGAETGTVTGTETSAEGEKITVTFNYGLNEEYLKAHGYKDGDVTYSKTVVIASGTSVSDSDAVLPGYGTEVGSMSFSYWADENGDYFYNWYELYKDTVITAHWDHTVTYHAEEGHFYNGDQTYTRTGGEGDTLLDLSPCCFPAAGTTRAFVGWGLKGEDGTLVSVYDLGTQLTVYQNMDLYAMYVDGYALTFDVNLEKGSINGFEMSYKDADGSNCYGDSQWLGDSETPVKTLTFTYPKGVRPTDANYFWANPLSGSSFLNHGDAAVEFDNWSMDKQGTEEAYFGNLVPPADGTGITLYASWKEYWVITFDPNRGDDNYYYKQTTNVIKGNTISYIPSGNFSYTDEKTGSYRCSSFNTAKDGSGIEIDYSFVPESDLTVYAQYTGIYYIYLNGNGGSVNDYSDYSVDRGDGFKYDLKNILVTWPDETDEKGNVVARSRKVLKEWRTNADGTGETLPFTPTADTTFYAIPEDGALITFHTGAREGDPENENGTIFNFRDKYNVTDASFAYSKAREMGSVPYPRYINEENKEFAGWSTEYGNPDKIIDPDKFVPGGDLDLYAVWYDLVPITYHACGGNFSSYSQDNLDTFTIKVRKGADFTPYQAPEPYLAGQVFAGWAERDGSTKTAAYEDKFTASGPMDFYAVWEAGYTITLDGNGGSVMYHSQHGHGQSDNESKATFTIRKGATVLESTGIGDHHGEYNQIYGWRDDGLILVGWSRTKDGEKIDLATVIPEKDETFYAIWEKPCKVTFDPDGGYLAEYERTSEVVKGSSVSMLPMPTAQNKYFVGWFLEDGVTRFSTDTVIDRDMTVKARWTDELVTVQFDAGENAVLDQGGAQSIALNIGKGALLDLFMYMPRRTDSSDAVFGGWKTDGYTWDGSSSGRYYEATKNVQFTAVWNTTKYYMVAFDGNGGRVISDDLEKSVIEEKIKQGSSVEKMIYAKQEGKVFTGWYLDKACTKLAATADKIESYIPVSDLTLYAGWKEEKKIPVTDIALLKEKLTLGINTPQGGKTEADSYELKVVVYPANASDFELSYTSSNDKVAAVSGSGVITAAGSGTAVITVSVAGEKISKTCEVTVNDKTASTVNSTLTTAAESMKDESGNAVSGAEAKTALDQALKSAGTADELADLVDSNDDTAKTLAALEESYTAAAKITVEDPAKDADNLGVIERTLGISKEEISGENMNVSGAGLNANPNETIGLSVKAVEKADEKAIDKKFENAKQVDIQLSATGENAERTVEELSAPVTLTLPIPSGMIRTKLYVLHFNADGSYELIRPTFKNNAMSFTVSHFSRFVFAELAEASTEDENGNGNGSGKSNGNGNGNGNENSNGNGTNNGNETTGRNGNGSGTENDNGSGTTGGTKTYKNGEKVKESGSKLQYIVISAANKTVSFAGGSVNSGKVTIKSKIKVGSVTFTVTAISAKALKNKKITAVVIPSTVKTIGSSAFEGAKKLKTVTIKGTKLSTIGTNAFKGCAVLKKITIPKGIKTVGKQAFANCKKLKTLTVKSKQTKFLKNSLSKVPSSAVVKLPKMTSKQKKAFKKMLTKTAKFKGKIK